MPVIKEYRPQVQIPANIQKTEYRAEQLGAQEGRARQRLGQTVTGIGDQLAKYIEDTEKSDVNTKLIKLNADYSVRAQETARTAKPGDNEPWEQLHSDLDDDLSALGEEVSTPGGRALFDSTSASVKGQVQKTSFMAQSELKGLKAANDLEESLNALSTSSLSDPSSYEHNQQLFNQTIENLISSGNLSTEQAERLRSEGSSRIATSTARGWINLSPEHAKKVLDRGDYDKVINGDQKAALYGEVDQAFRAREVEAERRRREAERVLQEQQKVTQNNFLRKMSENNLTTKEVLNSNLEPFGSGSKDQFIDMLKAKSRGDQDSDPAVMRSLFERIYLDDTDPRKILNEDELNQYFIKGQISFNDLNKLRDEMQGKHTEAGKIESDHKKQIKDEAEAILVKSNPLTGFRDVEGEKQYHKFMTFFLEEYKTQRAKGKSSAELLNPESPDYLGKYIVNFQKSQKQIMTDMTKTMKPPQKIPLPSETEQRKEKETPAEYLKRTKGAKK